jgi:hypothetical protein
MELVGRLGMQELKIADRSSGHRGRADVFFGVIGLIPGGEPGRVSDRIGNYCRGSRG